MKFSFALVLALMTSAQAATIAVVDSGVDYLHQQLAHKMWLNPIMEFKGDYPRASNGWNLIENNNQIFDHSLIKKFPSDIYRYFVVEARHNTNTLTDDDKAFIAEKLSDSEFVAKISSYGRYAHGTHVAGIAAKNVNHEIMGIKYIATNVASVLEMLKSSKTKVASNEEKLHYYLAYIAKMQGENFGKVVKFLDRHVADVVNGSFGASFQQMQRIGDNVFQEVYKKAPDANDSYKTAFILQHYVLEFYKQELAKTKNTLYVFAAGNDSSNNDLFPATPTNVNVENSISVAATQGSSALASFSNYGVKTVDIAAPGVNIYSAAPGTNNVPMSGTSQAAPLVSKVAGKIKDINNRLTAAQIKRILMDTVDKKAFLKSKVRSGGIVNEARALKAAELSLKLNLSRAIFEANSQVTQSPKSVIAIETLGENLKHIDLPSTFIE